MDVVADLHELSRHVAPASVDAAYSVVVWEHLLMPWKAVLELNRVLRPGGIAWIVTHKDYPIHDAPWDFYRFGRDSWPSLFNPSTGFRILSTAQHSPLRVVPLAVTIPTFESFGANQALVQKTAEVDPAACRWDVALSSLLPARHTYARKTSLGEHIVNKARRVLLRLGRGAARVSPDDPWAIGRRRGRWLFVRGPRARPLRGGAVEVSMSREGDASYRQELDGLPRRAFDGVALLDVLHNDPQPWTLAGPLHALLRPNGLLYVDAAQTALPRAGADFWGLSAEAFLGLFHEAVGFRWRRRAMLDPCAMTGPEMEEGRDARGWLRSIGLARRVTPTAGAERFRWPSPSR